MSYVQNVLSQVKEKNADQPEFIQAVTEVPVSYTHLDVYKRQASNR